jgi:hypothetical protein
MGRIFNTTDKGKTWQEINSPVKSTLFCICHDGPNLCGAGLDGAIIYSKDNGMNWQRAATTGTASLFDIAINGKTAVAVGDAGTVLLSLDGGIQWKEPGNSRQMRPFWMSTVSVRSESKNFTGIIGGAKGIIARLEKDGIHWLTKIHENGKGIPYEE